MAARATRTWFSFPLAYFIIFKISCGTGNPDIDFPEFRNRSGQRSGVDLANFHHFPLQFPPIYLL